MVACKALSSLRSHTCKTMCLSFLPVSDMHCVVGAIVCLEGSRQISRQQAVARQTTGRLLQLKALSTYANHRLPPKAPALTFLLLPALPALPFGSGALRLAAGLSD